MVADAQPSRAPLPLAEANRLEEELRASARGAWYADLYHRHLEEVRRLVTTDRRVTLVWHRSGAAEAFEWIMHAFTRPGDRVPEHVGGRPIIWPASTNSPRCSPATEARRSEPICRRCSRRSRTSRGCGTTRSSSGWARPNANRRRPELAERPMADRAGSVERIAIELAGSLNRLAVALHEDQVLETLARFGVAFPPSLLTHPGFAAARLSTASAAEELGPAVRGLVEAIENEDIQGIVTRGITVLNAVGGVIGSFGELTARCRPPGRRSPA